MSHDCCTPAAQRPDRREPTGTPDSAAPGRTPPLIALDGGEFRMGSDDPWAYPQDREGPPRQVQVAPFEIGATTVTVAEFARFVNATGYETDAERFGDSLVFAGVLGADAERWPRVAATPWWCVVAGADWRHPGGRGTALSSVADLTDHPVTHVSRRDAQVYCRWSGTDLPSEAQWEYAARGGLTGQPFPWGAELTPGGEHRMNVWQGTFPEENTAEDGWLWTAPARSYPPNGYGLFNTTGNVWEWTASGFDPDSGDDRAVMRGGSYLCHESYCRRYRVSARSAATEDTSSGHIGFRVIRGGA
ncbi:formylglycine-generating enzyme family protein [Rhodococcus triatomae]|nr:formylglycine-generating enzyme family protein [Rhodococcus triatomae]